MPNNNLPVKRKKSKPRPGRRTSGGIAYPEAKKEEAFTLWREGMILQEVATKVGTSTGTISKWKDKGNWVKRKTTIDNAAQQKADAVEAYDQSVQEQFHDDVNLELSQLCRATILRYAVDNGSGGKEFAPADSTKELKEMAETLQIIQKNRGMDLAVLRDPEMGGMRGMIKGMGRGGVVTESEMIIRCRAIYMNDVEEEVKELKLDNITDIEFEEVESDITN